MDAPLRQVKYRMYPLAHIWTAWSNARFGRLLLQLQGLENCFPFRGLVIGANHKLSSWEDFVRLSAPSGSLDFLSFAQLCQVFLLTTLGKRVCLAALLQLRGYLFSQTEFVFTAASPDILRFRQTRQRLTRLLSQSRHGLISPECRTSCKILGVAPTILCKTRFLAGTLV